MLYIRARNKQNENISYDFKAGCFENSLFYKLTVLYKSMVMLPFNFFHKLRMHAGVIHGHVHSSEKFFLGDHVRGYVPMSISPLDMNEYLGGKSCIELSNALGYRFRSMKLFVFNDFGFNSRQNNLFETVKSSMLGLLLVHKPSCLGWSTGIGLTVGLHKYKDITTNITMSYAIPLTEPQSKQSFKFEIDFDIL
ncbi:putative Bacterial surface antigen (D15) protein [Trachipleistophora hominis]|uniref:Putative Bacterial surface antigen (D15) protein n=1 Tax=Trachipleistophora hominis TaxID=72359 RepID=L7JW44_TRAHO|nr:putative Bacterial surface antigen (D15) protein [Trachipleistophora hominis]